VAQASGLDPTRLTADELVSAIDTPPMPMQAMIAQLAPPRRPFDRDEFAALLDHVFYRLNCEIRQHYRPGNAPPCRHIELHDEVGRLEVDIVGLILDGRRFRFGCELRRMTARDLAHVGFARICELYWQAEAEAFNNSYFHSNWRDHVELRNRIDDARRGLAPRPTTAEGFDGLRFDPRDPRYIEDTCTAAVEPAREAMTAAMARDMAVRLDREVMQVFTLDATFDGADWRFAGRLTDWEGFRPIHPDRARAVERGEKLLREWLLPHQHAQYVQAGHFDVVGCHSGRRYRITLAASYNVHELDEAGEVRARLCFLPEGELVTGDIMLAQKIALETDERAALAVANRDGGDELLRFRYDRPGWTIPSRAVFDFTT